MKREELTALIDRVIGSKGILRTPAYWMRKVLNKMSDYAEELKVSAVKESAEITSKKADVYWLPKSGNYAADSNTGKELLAIINNPDKVLIQSWVYTPGGKRLVSYNAATYSQLDGTIPYIVLRSPLVITSQSYTNNKLTKLQLTEFVATIGQPEGDIQISYSSDDVTIPITDIGDLDKILDNINGEEI